MNEQGILYHYLPTEQTPPEAVWQRLEKILDDAERNPLTELENLKLEPPVLAWVEIAKALDKKHENEVSAFSFAEVVSGLENTPPANAWANIEEALDNFEGTANVKIAKYKPIGAIKTIRKFAPILAAAACIGGAVFMGIAYFDGKPEAAEKNHVASIKNAAVTVLPSDSIKINKAQDVANTKRIPSTLGQQHPSKPIDTVLAANENLVEIDRERIAQLEKHANDIGVNDINTTNNKVASKTGKLRDADGNIIDRMNDHNTFSSGYIAAIGPNGNSVNVSVKLSDMIQFFQEDSTKMKEEYLDKVIRESNIWHQRFVDWKLKVDKADEKPSKMNFLDPIDLLRFLKTNR